MTIRPLLRFINAIVLLMAAARAFSAAAVVQAGEAEQITLHLVSGRTFTGAVDRRTTSDRLWLRVDKGGISILRPVDWRSIVDAQRGEQTLSRSQLLAAIDELRSSRKPNADEESTPEVAAPHEPTVQDSTPEAAPERNAPFERNAGPVPLVQSLQVDAMTGVWSSGVDSTGIVLDVSPLDGEGCLTPVDGTLEVDLFGDQYGSPTRGQDYRLLGHWVVRLDASQMTENGARLRLPFQAVSPDFRNDLSPYALVHVRLNAPGHGVFDATSGVTRLQRYDGLRGRLQEATGSRFFRNERTNRGRREVRAW